MLADPLSRRRFATGVVGLAAVVGTTRSRIARASEETQTTPPFFTIPVVVRPALKSQALITDPSACSVSSAIAAELGIGGQVRVCRDANHSAVYTITEALATDDPNEIRVAKAGRERLGTSTTGFAATLRQALSTSTLSDSQAQSAEEFVELVEDDGQHQGLLLLAPHGGAIELNTDRQARRVAAALPKATRSTWCCQGYQEGGGAYDRWHVTSTRIHPMSFPGLAVLAQRSFAYTVAFHGMSASGVVIGGAGSKQLKQLVRDSVAAALGGAAGPVSVASKGDALGGSNPANLANWLTAGGSGGIQIEQSYTVRSKYWREVADAVAGVYAGLV